MNASDRPNTCKSRGSEDVAIHLSATGARVSNAYATYPTQGNNPEKFGLIPHKIKKLHEILIKGFPVTDEHAYH